MITTPTPIAPITTLPPDNFIWRLSPGRHGETWNQEKQSWIKNTLVSKPLATLATLPTRSTKTGNIVRNIALVLVLGLGGLILVGIAFLFAQTFDRRTYNK